MLKALVELGFSEERAENYLALLIKALLQTGYSQDEAKVYLYLFFKGSQNAVEISSSLRIYKRKTYRILNRLKNRGIISSAPTFPEQYYAVPFDKVLDRILQELFQQVETLSKEKKDIIANWRLFVDKK
jgi:sugar-specific transcriptional regulator TrmB